MARGSAYLKQSQLKDICPIPQLPAQMQRQFLSLPELMDVKKPAVQWDALHATVALALMMHLMGLFSYLVFNPETRAEDYKFFTDVQLASKSEIAMTEMEKPKPPPPPKPVEPPKPVVRPPNQPMAIQPAQPAPAPKPVKVPTRVAAPQAPVRTAPVARPDSNLNTMTARHGTGDPLPTGRGGGDPKGVPGGTGQGEGPGGKGTGGTGTGGTGTGSGGPPPPPAPPGERVHSTTEYSNFGALNIPFPGSDPTGGMKTWEDLCKALGLDYQGDICRRPTVPPIFTGAGNPEHMLGTQAGLVRVSVLITASGKPTQVAIVRSGGSRELDSVGQYIAENTAWLPALAYGKPVDQKIEYDIKFASPNNPNPTYGQ